MVPSGEWLISVLNIVIHKFIIFRLPLFGSNLAFYGKLNVKMYSQKQVTTILSLFLVFR